ncbi:MAG: hypothetical protein LBB78_11930 [Spirochaetaceae bacterium]|jgi:hypothetical protein|nr:hypothetical protein [Spirochaetaceae bacterium]
MKYTDEQLNSAVKNNIFTDEQVKSFREYIQGSNNQATKLQKVLYYGGGLIIISAMTWLMKKNWDIFGPAAITFFSAIYFVAFLFSGYIVFFKKKLEIPGGLLLSIPIAVTPLFVFSLLQVFNFWPQEWDYNDYYIWIKGKWVIIELVTILVAISIFIKTKFPFHVFLIAGTLWWLSMDIVPIIYEQTKLTWTERAIISDLFGLLMISIGYLVDIKSKKDYSFWLYLFGLIILTSGLSVFYNDNIFKFIILGIINVLLIFFSIFINRNVFLVFGTIGLTEFMSRLSWEFFEDSAFFPVALTVIGVLLIVSGIFLQKNKKKIDEYITNRFPDFILKLRPKNDF